MTSSPSGRRTAVTAALAVPALLLAACGGGFDEPQSGPEQAQGPAALEVLIGSSAPAEIAVVRELADQWASRTGNTVEITPAQELNQQLGQAFAGGEPPDVFYLDPPNFSRYQSAGSLFSYGAELPGAADIVPNLAETYTVDGQLVCAPKDFSTLALILDTDAWSAAGLTDADVPTTWDELADVAQRLTTPQRRGLVFDASRDRVGAFFRQAGGWYVDEDGAEATADSPENLQALQFVQQLLTSGSTAFPAQVDAGWGGEAFGTGRAAMTIEGNWIAGALRNDYPDRKWRAVELPAGPAGPGTLAFTNCWGVPSQSQYQQQAADLVAYLMQPDQQLQQAEAFGVIPAVQTAAATYGEQNPDLAAFVAGGDYAQGQVRNEGFVAVFEDFDTQLQGLATGDPAQLLATLQANADQALEE